MEQEHSRLSPDEEAVVALMARAKSIVDIAAEFGLQLDQAQRLADGALEKLLTYQSHNDAAIERLDQRHLGVLEQLALGLPNKEIEQALHYRTGYLKKLVEEVYGALGVNNRTEAALRYNAWRGGRDADPNDGGRMAVSAPTSGW